jgi:uncharacterized protein YbjQ (UPF0145 family)
MIKLRTALVLSILFVLITACAVSSPLTPAGAAIRVVTQTSVGDTCAFIAPITVTKGNGISSSYANNYEQAMNEVRNQAAAAGGNAVVFNDPVMVNPQDPGLSAVSLTGMAYVCR